MLCRAALQLSVLGNTDQTRLGWLQCRPDWAEDMKANKSAVDSPRGRYMGNKPLSRLAYTRNLFEHKHLQPHRLEMQVYEVCWFVTNEKSIETAICISTVHPHAQCVPVIFFPFLAFHYIIVSQERLQWKLIKGRTSKVENCLILTEFEGNKLDAQSQPWEYKCVIKYCQLKTPAKCLLSCVVADGLSVHLRQSTINARVCNELTKRLSTCSIKTDYIAHWWTR